MKLYRSLLSILISTVLVTITGCVGIRPIQFSADAGGAIVADAPLTMSLEGKWKFKTDFLTPANYYEREIDDDAWMTVDVPANWYLQGIDFSGAAWYRTRFQPPQSFRGKMIRLIFDGVDYAADVWLNGNYLGFHEGYFQPFEFDISENLDFDRDNVLAVRVNSPYEEPEKFWSLKKRLIKGIFNHHDTRPGGAWSIRGQDRNTGGIWSDVYLRASDLVRLSDTRCAPDFRKSGQLADGADVKLMIEQSVVIDDRTAGVPLRYEFEVAPHNFAPTDGETGRLALVRSLRQGIQQVQVTMTVSKAKLWWTWEHGKPNLYKLISRIYYDGKMLDKKEEIIGFRSITVDPETKTWHLNGRPIFFRGTNYISSQWLSEMTEDRYARDLELMKRANINIIRVHAHIEAKLFYHLCDEMGIMVWQDFPLQWGYSDSAAFVTQATHQVRDMIDHLYNHASIAAWCLHNEPPWDASWMKWKYDDYDPDQNRDLDEVLFKAAVSEDATRYVHMSSSTSEHPWFGWYSGSLLDYQKPTKEPLITEFGAQALPDLESLRMVIPQDILWPETDHAWDVWQYHNFQKKETFELAGVPMGETIDEFIRNTQDYQSRLIQFAAESYRRQKYSPVVCIYQFMFVENWPSINWGIVDYWRNPKPGYAALQRAYQPVLPSIELSKLEWKKAENIDIHFWVVNDLWSSIDQGSYQISIQDNEGNPILNKEQNVNVHADSVMKVLSIQTTLDPGDYRIMAELTDRDGVKVAQNHVQIEIAP